jgi:hypothetical protein
VASIAIAIANILAGAAVRPCPFRDIVQLSIIDFLKPARLSEILLDISHALLVAILHRRKPLAFVRPLDQIVILGNIARLKHGQIFNLGCAWLHLLVLSRQIVPGFLDSRIDTPLWGAFIIHPAILYVLPIAGVRGVIWNVFLYFLTKAVILHPTTVETGVLVIDAIFASLTCLDALVSQHYIERQISWGLGLGLGLTGIKRVCVCMRHGPDTIISQVISVEIIIEFLIFPPWATSGLEHVLSRKFSVSRAAGLARHVAQLQLA